MLVAKVPPVIVRLLINIYSMQTAEVEWKGQNSREFQISNGVRQGAVLSLIIYCFFMNDMFDLLRKSRSGCWVGHLIAGVFGCADNLLLIRTPGNIKHSRKVCSLNIVKEITNVRHNVLQLEDDENEQFTDDDLCNILDYVKGGH